MGRMPGPVTGLTQPAPQGGSDPTRVLVTDARSLRTHLVERRRVEVSLKQIIAVLAAFERGQKFILAKYPNLKPPPLYVTFSGNPGLVDQGGEVYIALPLDRIVAYSETARIERSYDTTAPVKTHLTVQQDLEGVGVEETLHFAQKEETPGLVALPPPEVPLVDPYQQGFLSYFLQPWEFEGVVVRGDWF